MAITRKTNDTVTVPASALTGAAMFQTVCRSFVHHREAALLSTYSVTAFLLVVNYFTGKDDKAYMSEASAIKYVGDEIEKQTSVKHRMLDNYINTGRTLYDKIKASPKLFSEIIADISKLTDAKADAAPVMLKDWFEKNQNVKGLNELMAKLGYAVRKPQTAPASADPANAPAAAGDAIKRAVKLMIDKGHKRGADAERAVAQSVANTFDNPIILAKQALARVTEPEDLLDLAKFCNDMADRLAAEIDKTAKADKAKEAKAAKTKAKAKPATQHTQA